MSSAEQRTAAAEVARQQAQAEELTLLVAENEAGYYGVYLANPGKPMPYQAQVRRGGKQVHLRTWACSPPPRRRRCASRDRRRGRRRRKRLQRRRR